MVLILSALLMEMALHQAPRAPGRPPVAACPVTDHIELARTPSLMVREVCISPGILTGFLFDVATNIELQDETRFLNLSQSRDAISFMPPANMVVGERLRLTARLGEKQTQREVSFVLVVHAHQATHQVQVYHDPRPRESFLLEIERQQALIQQLEGNNERLQRQVEQAHVLTSGSLGLSGAYLVGVLEATGIRTRGLDTRDSSGTVYSTTATSYRSWRHVAVNVKLENQDDVPWMAVGASLIEANGRRMSHGRAQQHSTLMLSSTQTTTGSLCPRHFMVHTPTITITSLLLSATTSPVLLKLAQSMCTVMATIPIQSHKSSNQKTSSFFKMECVAVLVPSSRSS